MTVEGIEPSAYGVGIRRSTTELRGLGRHMAGREICLTRGTMWDESYKDGLPSSPSCLSYQRRNRSACSSLVWPWHSQVPLLASPQRNPCKPLPCFRDWNHKTKTDNQSGLHRSSFESNQTTKVNIQGRLIPSWIGGRRL